MTRDMGDDIAGVFGGRPRALAMMRARGDDGDKHGEHMPGGGEQGLGRGGTSLYAVDQFAVGSPGGWPRRGRGTAACSINTSDNVGGKLGAIVVN